MVRLFSSLFSRTGGVRLPQPCAESGLDPWADQRERMVREQILQRGIRDPRVLEAMRKVPRHLLFPPSCGIAPTEIAPCPSATARRSLSPISLPL
jgi:hypothetical protein